MTASRMELERPSRWELRFGARPRAAGGTEFRAWAPLAKSLDVKLVGEGARASPLESVGEGVFEARVEGVGVGQDYFYVVGGERERPDPVSRSQASGVNGPSRVVAPEAFERTDESWRGIPLKDFVVYELHTGTFTPEGAFDSVVQKLSRLKSLGVTAVTPSTR